MKIIETTVYEFQELPEPAKERAREWYRRASDGDNYFAESVIDDAAEIASMMGLDICQRPVKLMGGGTRYEPSVYWSGFGSQGDGACFAGTWRASDVKPGAVSAHVGNSEPCQEIKRIAAEFERLALAFPTSSFSVRHTGRYSHERSVSFDLDSGLDYGEETPETKAQDMAWETAQEDLREAARDFMNWIYRGLETEWDYQNADTQVDESIMANDYTFTEDGARFGA